MKYVDVVYAPLTDPLIQVQIPFVEGLTVKMVVEQSKIADRYPDVFDGSVGIFSKQVSWDRVVKAGDRVELYRPLLLDPMEKRRQRVR